MVNELTIYEEITKIAEDYFGPMAPRYIARMVSSHLSKEPHQVTARDLPELINWIQLTTAMLTEEAQTIHEFITRLNALSEE